MDNIEKEIGRTFGGRLRVRVNGVLIEEDKILLIQHKMSEDRAFWAVPGGGMDYGSDVISNLRREFLEETGLEVAVKDFLFVYEFLEPPLHALEIYFEVEKIAGELKIGTDPELEGGAQIIVDLAFLNVEEIAKIKNEEKHRLFRELKSLNEIRMWKGYFNFGNKCIK